MPSDGTSANSWNSTAADNGIGATVAEAKRNASVTGVKVAVGDEADLVEGKFGKLNDPDGVDGGIGHEARRDASGTAAKAAVGDEVDLAAWKFEKLNDLDGVDGGAGLERERQLS